MLLIAGETPAPLTPEELDDIDPKELEYRCPHAAMLNTLNPISHSSPTFLAAFLIHF